MPIFPPAYALEALCAGRCTFAAVFLVAPQAGVRAIGLDGATARRVTWLTRMMAVRDGAIGVGALWATRRGGDPRPWLAAGAASDAVDALAIAGALRNGRLRGAPPKLVVTAAAGIAGLGAVLALGRDH